MNTITQEIQVMTEEGGFYSSPSVEAMREIVIHIVNTTSRLEWKSTRPYMRKLVADAYSRIIRYKKNPGMLSFGHNECIMISRLYRRL